MKTFLNKTKDKMLKSKKIWSEDYVKQLRKYEDEFKFYLAEPFGCAPGSKHPIDNLSRFENLCFILKALSLPRKSKLLEIGCGSGWLAIFLFLMEYDVTSTTITKDEITISNKKAKKMMNAKPKFILDDITNTKIRGKFDAIILNGTFHHLKDKTRALKNCLKLLYEDGRLIIIEPGEKHNQSGKVRDIENKYNIRECGTSMKEMKKCLSDSGFRKISFCTSKNIFFHSFREMIYQIGRLLNPHKHKKILLVLAYKKKINSLN